MTEKFHIFILAHTHCKNNQWTLRTYNGRNLGSTVTLEPRTSTQCWSYHTSPAQCSNHENHIHPLWADWKKYYYNHL